MLKETSRKKLFSFYLGILTSDLIHVIKTPSLILSSFLIKLPDWNIKDSEGLGKYMAGLYYNNMFEVIIFIEKCLLNPNIERILCIVFYLLTKYQQNCIDPDHDPRFMEYMEKIVETMTIPMVHKVHLLDLRDLQKKKSRIE